MNVTNPDTGVAVGKYWYDDQGFRVRKVARETSGSEVIDTEVLYPSMYFGLEKKRYDNGGDVENSHCAVNNVYLNGVRVAAVLPSGKAFYYLTDQVDSVKVVVSDSGAPVSRMEYLPFGDTWFQEGDLSHNPKYNSQELDKETGYYFYNARHYDAGISRFVTPDTVIDGEMSTQGWNRYAYVHNNPVRYKDPTGHKSFVFERDLDSPAPGVHSYNVAVSKNPAKEWGEYYEKNKDEFSTYKLEKDALGYKKGDEITYRIMGGSAKAMTGEKLVKTKSDHEYKQVRETTESDRDSFLQYLRTDKDNERLSKLREEQGFKNKNWNAEGYELLKDGKESSKMDVDIMKVYDSYNEQATYRLHGQGSDSGNCHSITRSISERGGATNYEDVDGISPGDKVMPDKFFE